MTFNPADPDAPYRRAAQNAGRTDPVPEGYQPSPYPARRVPPMGKSTHSHKHGAGVEPGLASKILVWGGITAAAAAATAGAVLAVRAVVDGISGSDEDDAVEAARERARIRAKHGKKRRPHPAGMPRNAYAPTRRGPPQFADFAPRDRDEDRERIERQRRAARDHARRGSQHHEGPGVVESLTRSVTDVTNGLRDAMLTVTAAIEGFRGVAGQAGSIMDEFRAAADSVSTMFDGGASRGTPAEAAARRRTTTAAGTPVVDLRDHPADPEGERTHRL